MKIALFPIGALIGLALSACSQTSTEVTVNPRTERAIAAVKLDTAEALATINAYRASRGLRTLRLDPELSAMAQKQADGMAASGELSHNAIGGFSSRLAASRIDTGEAGENLGGGYYSFGEAMTGWKGSPEHDANLRGAGFTRLGVALAKNAKTSWGAYWVTEFAGEPREALAQ